MDFLGERTVRNVGSMGSMKHGMHEAFDSHRHEVWSLCSIDDIHLRWFSLDLLKTSSIQAMLEYNTESNCGHFGEIIVKVVTISFKVSKGPHGEVIF